MEDISKPRLVDLLRTFDKMRWLVPRIRYASVRSKPMLIKDLREFYTDVRDGDFVLFKPKTIARLARVPDIRFNVPARQFLMDGIARDLPRHSRRPVHFSVSREAVTLFGEPGLAPDSPPLRDLPATQIIPAVC